jgi:penicillin-binding protein 1C
MGEAATFIVSDMLADRAGRALAFGLDNPLATRFWTAVKTGTSKDMRDNWCIGYSARFTVAVWVGNFEGDSMHDVSGVTGAAPAWLEIMNGLHQALPSQPPAAPPGLVRLPVTYQPAQEAERNEWFLAGTETSIVRRLDAEHGAPRIESPPNGVVIALDPDIPLQHQKVPLQAAGMRQGMVLELDGVRLGPAVRTHRWQPKPGRHRLVLAAADGKPLHDVRFTVRGLHAANTPEPTEQPDQTVVEQR